jgi:hypothetical protein
MALERRYIASGSYSISDHDEVGAAAFLGGWASIFKGLAITAKRATSGRPKTLRYP